MKMIRTSKVLFALTLALVFLNIPFAGKAQLDYSFTNYTLVSGTDLQPGAVYRFKNVKSGVDAMVTIKSFNNGAKLDILDETGTGFDGAFQPRVKIAANSTNSYVEFQIDFVITNTILPMPQAMVYLTAIDIDGHRTPNDTLFEFDNINLGVTSIVDFEALLGGLSVTSNGLWKGGKNTNGVEYAGIDTVAKNVMYTVSGALVTSIGIRSGGDNSANGPASRQRSLIFERFSYPNSVLLPLPKILSFTGSMDRNKISLGWQFDSKDGLSQCVLERATGSGSYSTVATFNITPGSGNSFSYSDYVSANGDYSYRVKMIGTDGKIEYSKVLSFQVQSVVNKDLKVFPTLVRTSATVSINVPLQENSILQVSDMSGRIVKQQKLNLVKGNNNVTATGFDQFSKGNYVISVKTDAGILSKQIVVQ